VIYFNFDNLERSSPFVTAKDGKPLDKNPLLDVRVRRAISKAINRPAIAERVMEGQAIPVRPARFGEALRAQPGAQARALRSGGCEEASRRGRATPTGSTSRSTGPRAATSTTRRSCRPVAQMLSRIGITAKVETAPDGTLFEPRVEAGVQLPHGRLGRVDRRGSSPLRSLLATYNRDKGLGAVNWGRYSNAKVDYLIEQALQQVNDENRTIMLQRATDLAMQDLGIMPIHFQFTMWATKKNVQYTPRTDEYTLAFQFKPLDKMAGAAK
jgi:peptide/nickel transport system substrate-binding protein